MSGRIVDESTIYNVIYGYMVIYMEYRDFGFSGANRRSL